MGKPNRFKKQHEELDPNDPASLLTAGKVDEESTQQNEVEESDLIGYESPTPDSPVIGKDFLAKFVEPKSEGKTYSVYLSAEAGKKLEKLAKQLKCSKSKALDILLKNAVE